MSAKKSNGSAKKAGSANAEPENYDTRDVVLGHVRGFPPWPGMVGIRALRLLWSGWDHTARHWVLGTRHRAALGAGAASCQGTDCGSVLGLPGVQLARARGLARAPEGAWLCGAGVATLRCGDNGAS
jgi:hypothetical protein